MTSNLQQRDVIIVGGEPAGLFTIPNWARRTK
jgi:thioredoxin reductase